jgi:hypothetical protein
MDITLITAFFDLNSLEVRPTNRTNKDYMKWGQFVLGLDVNLVIYIERKNFNYIFNERLRHNLLHKTKIVIREFNQLCFYNIRSDISLFLKMNPITNGTIKDTANYLITTWNKLYLIEETMKDNPFKNKYYGWIDFGIRHVIRKISNKELCNKLTGIDDKISVLELRLITDKDIENIYDYCSQFRWKIAGGFFTGSKQYMIQFIKYFKEQLYLLLSMRIGAHEESIFGLIYRKHNNIFSPYYGNYQELLDNYNTITKYNELIKWNIKYSRQNQYYDHALSICNKVYTDMYNKLSNEDKIILNDEIIINSFYVNKDQSLLYANRWLTELENNKDQVKELTSHKSIDRIRSNLSFYNNNYINRFNKICYEYNNNQ